MKSAEQIAQESADAKGIGARALASLSGEKKSQSAFPEADGIGARVFAPLAGDSSRNSKGDSEKIEGGKEGGSLLVRPSSPTSGGIKLPFFKSKSPTPDEAGAAAAGADDDGRGRASSLPDVTDASPPPGDAGRLRASSAEMVSPLGKDGSVEGDAKQSRLSTASPRTSSSGHHHKRLPSEPLPEMPEPAALTPLGGDVDVQEGSSPPSASAQATAVAMAAAEQRPAAKAAPKKGGWLSGGGGSNHKRLPSEPLPEMPEPPKMTPLGDSEAVKEGGGGGSPTTSPPNVRAAATAPKEAPKPAATKAKGGGWFGGWGGGKESSTERDSKGDNNAGGAAGAGSAASKEAKDSKGGWGSSWGVGGGSKARNSRNSHDDKYKNVLEQRNHKGEPGSASALAAELAVLDEQITAGQAEVATMREQLKAKQASVDALIEKHAMTLVAMSKAEAAEVDQA